MIVDAIVTVTITLFPANALAPIEVPVADIQGSADGEPKKISDWEETTFPIQFIHFNALLNANAWDPNNRTA